MQPTLFTAAYSSSRAAETPVAAAVPRRIPRKKGTALVAPAVAAAHSLRSLRATTGARPR